MGYNLKSYPDQVSDCYFVPLMIKKEIWGQNIKWLLLDIFYSTYGTFMCFGLIKVSLKLTLSLIVGIIFTGYQI